MNAQAGGLGVLMFAECESLVVRRAKSDPIVRLSAVASPRSAA